MGLGCGGWPRRWMRGPAAHGFGDDQRWTLIRVPDLIARMFRTRYTLRGTSCLLHRIGWSVQVRRIGPSSVTRRRSRRGGGRCGRRENGSGAARRVDCFEDEAGQALRPPKARTWGRRGETPQIRSRARASGESRFPAWPATNPASVPE
ncbi:helix-turn-helix domain-containing protein [Actinoplanes xinjiangensis]|nr:winged helix-turn-helix domain-containing protein [Actinoplanes xinjiangensis]